MAAGDAVTDPLVAAADAISTSSPKTRAFAQLAAQRIIALEHPPAPTPTPTPTPTPSRGGIGFQAYGHAPPANVAAYDLAILDQANVPAALLQIPRAGRTLVYMAALDVNAATCLGVTLAEAEQNDWLLRDAAGVPLLNAAYPANRLGDVGTDGYRARWAANVYGIVTALGCDGVYIDDVHGDWTLIAGGVIPAKYPTRSAQQAAMAGFIGTAARTLRNAGLYVAVNAKSFTPGDPKSNVATNDAAWWRLIGPNVSALVYEYWQQNPNAVDQVFTSDPAKGWLGQWPSWQILPSVAREVGADFWGLVYGSPATLDYARASFLLSQDGTRGGIVAADSSLAWTKGNLGSPLGGPSFVGSKWSRKFERGTVTLDSLAGTATIVQV